MPTGPLRLLLAITGCLATVLLLLRLHGSHSPTILRNPFSGLARPDSSLEDALNQTLGFQKIFVINLPVRSDHRDSLSLAAALTPGSLKLDYIDGVTNISESALPPGGDIPKFKKVQAAWRAHINVLRTIVEQNITSALILEDDVDWDVRIKSQMLHFAKASRLLVQPGLEDNIFDNREEPLRNPHTSPYGDINRWDLFWLGHCGTQFVESNSKIHKGRVIFRNDETTPSPARYDKEFGSDELMDQYPAYTRVVHRARENVCSLAYAVSQPGARRFLYELGIKKVQAEMDIMMREMCDGTDGRPLHSCLTVQPQLFQHHRPVGKKSGFSDLKNHWTGYDENGYNNVAYTKNIRWSTRLNLRKLVDGRTDYIDSADNGWGSTIEI